MQEKDGLANENKEHVACIGSSMEKGTEMGTGGEVIWGSIVVYAWEPLCVGLAM